jgi:hypothetical protein
MRALLAASLPPAVLGKGDPAEIAQAYRRIIDGTLDDES